jgi:RNA polymerase sigma-70 factor (ECF subfamily)
MTVTEAIARSTPRSLEAETFAQVVDETAPRLYRLAARLLGSAPDAEDVLQESYTRAFDAYRRGRFGARATAFTWLYRIVTHVAVNHLRGRRRAGAREREWVPSGPDAQRQLEASLELRELARYLDLLTEEQRAVLVLKELEGLSTFEVAEVLDCSVGAVEQRLLRARAALQARCNHG